METIRFIKLHGTGNDFVFVDGRPGHAAVSPGLAARLCDRHFGIGADGVLVLSRESDGTPRMTIYNADGSLAEMCGNGLRCFVKVLVEHLGFTDNPLTVQTGAGAKVCRWEHGRGETLVRVSMGPVRSFDGTVLLSPGLRPERLEAAGRTVEVWPVSTGNPHAVLFGPFAAGEPELLGPALGAHPRFPRGVNVGFLSVRSPRALELRVYERGCGLTLACGTGAVAATAVAVSTGRSPAGEMVCVALPGGELRVSVSQDFSESVLEGPAVEIFSGEIG